MGAQFGDPPPVSLAMLAGHLETLADRAPDAVAAYAAMARRTTERALAAGRLRRHEAAPLLDLLAAQGLGPGSLASERAEG